MRERKHRFWGELDSRMVYGLAKAHELWDEPLADLLNDCDDFVFRVDGRDYYEGDIVELNSVDIGGNIYVGEIQFNTDIALDRLAYGLMTKRGWLATDFMGKITYLGNRYENPELLS